VKAMVTGAAGFVGRAIVEALVSRGVAVVAVDRPDRARSGVGRELLGLDLGEIGAAGALISSQQPDLVVHAAWYTNPRDYLTAPANIRSLRITVDLVQAAVERSVRHVIALGTCVEYAPSESPRQEEALASPTSPYGACKLAALLTARELTRGSGTRLTWARLFHVHGPRDNPQRLLPSIARALQDGRPVQLTRGDQVRDHLHVQDVADAVALLAQVESPPVVNICSGRPVTLSAILTELADIWGRSDLLRFGERPYGPLEIRHLVGDAKRLRALGWSPRHNDLRSDLEEIAAEVRDGSTRPE